MYPHWYVNGKIFLQNQIFFPVYPHWHSIFLWNFHRFFLLILGNFHCFFVVFFLHFYRICRIFTFFAVFAVFLHFQPYLPYLPYFAILLRPRRLASNSSLYTTCFVMKFFGTVRLKSSDRKQNTPNPLVHIFFAYRKISEAQNGSSPSFWHMQLKNSDGKTWYPPPLHILFP